MRNAQKQCVGRHGVAVNQRTALRRLPSLPRVPTLLESGLHDYDPSFWIGLAVPKGTPAPVIAGLNKTLNELCRIYASTRSC